MIRSDEVEVRLGGGWSGSLYFISPSSHLHLTLLYFSITSLYTSLISLHFTSQSLHFFTGAASPLSSCFTPGQIGACPCMSAADHPSIGSTPWIAFDERFKTFRLRCGDSLYALAISPELSLEHVYWVSLPKLCYSSSSHPDPGQMASSGVRACMLCSIRGNPTKSISE